MLSIPEKKYRVQLPFFMRVRDVRRQVIEFSGFNLAESINGN